MPSDLALKTMNAVHRAIQRLSFGRLGWQVGAMPVIELTTTGRKSGQPRTVFLTSPLRDGEAYVLVASRGGDDHHPAWFLNLRDNPAVHAKIGGGARRPMQARVADAEQRARYQTRTDREIPLVLLEPAT